METKANLCKHAIYTQSQPRGMGGTRRITMGLAANLRTVGLVATVVGVCMMSATGASAIALDNNNTHVDVTGTAPGQTIDTWVVNGLDHLADSAGLIDYYIRIGSGTAVPLSSLSTGATYTVSNPTSIPTPLGTYHIGPTTYYVQRSYGWTNPATEVFNQIEIDTTYSITGLLGSSGSSDIGVSIQVKRISGDEAQLISIYEYNNLNLSGTAANETAWISPATDAHVTDDQTTFHQVSSQTLRTGPYTVESVAPAYYQVGPAGLGNYDFNNNLTNTSSYSGDVAFVYEFQFTLEVSGPGSNQSILIDKNVQPLGAFVVPEPASTGLGLMGLATLVGSLLSRRSRRR
jgi:hypothetical protein